MWTPDTVARIQSLWNRKGVLPTLLRLIACIYGQLVAFNHWLYRRGYRSVYRSPVPVLVVGNVVAGGAGKTPTVMALVQHLAQSQWRVGVVSRGYGRRSQACVEVNTHSDPALVGDEPLLMARRCRVPVFVASQRAQAVRSLLAHYPHTNLIVCDDGLQHHALGRDLEVVVFDERGLGNGRLLPAGWLREPWPRGIQAPATLTLCTVATDPPPGACAWTTTRQLANTLVNGHGQTRSLESLRSTAVVAIAAIAKPEAFFEMLALAGIRPTHCVGLPDHFDFQGWTLPSAQSPDGSTDYICTEKDAVKLWDRYPQVWAAPLQFQPEHGFFEALDAALQPLRR